MIFKVEMMKAYDHFSWNFLEFVLKEMDFGLKWTRWMRVCISNARFSVMAHLRVFQKFQGPRAGDPLCPLLFIIVTEYLSRMIDMLVENGVIDGFRVYSKERSMVISHLQFEDDPCSYLTLTPYLVFQLCPGRGSICTYTSYTKVGEVDRFKELANVQDCGLKNFPCTYLGLPLGARSFSFPIWEKVLEKMATRLARWITKCLPVVGRNTLLKATSI